VGGRAQTYLDFGVKVPAELGDVGVLDVQEDVKLAILPTPIDHHIVDLQVRGWKSYRYTKIPILPYTEDLARRA
jgi:hypothetical protein